MLETLVATLMSSLSGPRLASSPSSSSGPFQSLGSSLDRLIGLLVTTSALLACTYLGNKYVASPTSISKYYTGKEGAKEVKKGDKIVIDEKGNLFIPASYLKALKKRITDFCSNLLKSNGDSYFKCTRPKIERKFEGSCHCEKAFACNLVHDRSRFSKSVGIDSIVEPPVRSSFVTNCGSPSALLAFDAFEKQVKVFDKFEKGVNKHIHQKNTETEPMVSPRKAKREKERLETPMRNQMKYYLRRHLDEEMKENEGVV
ncbi:hypothetical protein TL16_g10813 [Triparma laevis f. inornata]|uniref:Uncharacterized protein n=2 Tax=Triparma laevis TaxID=1534972 RepID=A0A9W7CG47_9STRA|nr:hypothetical protein TL16_g10813 [Triparma laevis f. inornata]GMI08028.1 hypothetical protein TrLO_g5393 [Triparma laevis f. longispina]